MHKTYALLRGFESYVSYDVLRNGDGGCLNDHTMWYFFLQDYRDYGIMFRKKEYRGTNGWDDGDGSTSNIDLYFEQDV